MKLLVSNQHDPDASPTELEVRRSGDQLEVRHGDRTFLVSGSALGGGVYALQIEGRPIRFLSSSQGEDRALALGAQRFSFKVVDKQAQRRKGRREGLGDGSLTSSMPGQVLKILVAAGESVNKGQPLVIVEAMKMEHEIKAPANGRVKRLACSVGELVSSGVALLELEPLLEPLE